MEESMWPFSSQHSDSSLVKPPQATPSNSAGPTLLAATKEMDQRYRRDLWFAREKDRLGTLSFIALLFTEIVIASIGVFVFLDYYVLRYPAERSLLTAFAPNTVLHSAVQSQTPQTIGVDSAQVFVARSGSYDAMTFTKNPNEKWVADIYYVWTWDGGKSAEQNARLLPGESRPLVLFGIEGSRPKGMEIQVNRIEWWRVNPQQVRDPVAWVNARLRVRTSDVVHDDRFQVGEKVVGRTSFTLTNETGYGYRDMLMVLVAQKGSAAVGLHQFTVSDLAPHESRTVQVDWFGQAPVANGVAIYPVVDVFDPSMYTSLSADPGIDRRDMLYRR